jgi:Tol biopolymer transport system component
MKQSAFGGPGEQLFPLSSPALEDWSRDGKYLAVSSIGTSRAEVRPVDGGAPLLVAQGTNVDETRFSPDGKWIAYNSRESGRDEVYVTTMPPSGERWPVSTSGGVQARWSANPHELFYLSLDGMMISVSITGQSRPEVGNPVALFKTGLTPTWNIDHYGVAPDGKRFLLKVPGSNGDPARINVIANRQ